jgi:hypothetical protein
MKINYLGELGGFLEQHRVGQRSVFAFYADVVTLVDELVLGLEDFDLLLGVVSETDLAGDDDVLSAGKFVLASAEGLEGVLDMLLLYSDGTKDVTNFNSASLSVGLTPGSSHTSLETISTSAGQHLVDSEGVPRVLADSEVETVLGELVGQVFVGGNTAGFESFGGDLLALVGDEVDANGEVVPGGLLESGVVESKFGVGTGSVVTRLGVSLSLNVAVASSWSSAH